MISYPATVGAPKEACSQKAQGGQIALKGLEYENPKDGDPRT